MSNKLDKLLYDTLYGNTPSLEIDDNQPVKASDVEGLEELIEEKISEFGTGEGLLGGTNTDIDASLLEDATTDSKGVTQLSNAIDSTDSSKSATPLAVSSALTEAKNYTNTEITKLSTISDAKYASNAHKHEISDTNDLQEELDKKALKTDLKNLKINFDNHIHEISDITDLQAVLDNKAPIVHVHDWSQITGKPTTSPAQIDQLANDSHSHPNIELLNNLEDGNGILIYNGNPLGETSYLSVQTIAERDAIPMEARKEGLMVLVLEDGGVYYLKGGTDNAFWQIFSVGSGGAVNASTLPATPSGNLTGLNTQSLLDELEIKKADKNDVYSKAETENFIKSYPIDYVTLENLPDLSTLHGHDNKETLDLFSQFQGNLTWNGKTLGDLVAELYDANLDGIIDNAQKLEGVNATAEELNALTGITGNIQQQINSISSGVTFKGVFPTYADMEANLVNPIKGDLVYIDVDETKDGALDTQYVYDGTYFVYGGGTTKTPDATSTTKGVIQLGGDLAGVGSSATAPKLTPTGVTGGLYKNANLTISEDGRIIHAEEGTSVFLNDNVVSNLEGWSSQKIDSELSKKAERTHTHDQLHDSTQIGQVSIKDELPNDKYVLTYDQVEGKAKWSESQGGEFVLGSKRYKGDLTFRAGSYITLSLDDLTGELVIGSTFREGGSQAMIPSGFELLHSVEVEASSSVKFSIPTGFNKYMLHTVQMRNDKSVTGEIKMYNQGFSDEGVGFIEYNSNSEIQISDIVNIPIFDYDNSKMAHIEVVNYGIEPATFNIRLKCTNLL